MAWFALIAICLGAWAAMRLSYAWGRADQRREYRNAHKRFRRALCLEDEVREQVDQLMRHEPVPPPDPSLRRILRCIEGDEPPAEVGT